MSGPHEAARFGPLLREYRLAAGLTQETLAERSGVSARTIQQLETGSMRPRHATAVSLAEALALAGAVRTELESLAGPAPRRRIRHIREPSRGTPGGTARRREGRDNLAVARPHPPDAARPRPLVPFPRLAPVAEPPLDSPNAQARTLPVQTTPLIGREQISAAIQTVLLRDEVRLVTLTGPGGTGKTRLGLQVAADVLDQFEHGACFVDLAPISDPALVMSAIAQALDVQGAAGRPLLDVLMDAVRGRELLLLLDNFEQVLPAALDVDALLRACPRLTVLVTSRAALRLRGEHEFPVPPLSLPPGGASMTPASLARYPAVALFVERATAVRPDFSITAENAPALVEICMRLDGLPLAIELAAARTRPLPPRALLARLERRLPLLTGGPRDLPARQQTLRGTIAWSYDLLDEPEQRLFERLGVFVGGCTLEAIDGVGMSAQAIFPPRSGWVAGDRGTDTGPTAPKTQHPTPNPLDLIASLVAQNLLRQQEQPDGEPRFSMLETIREYALERLEARGEATTVRRRHAEHFMALAEEAGPWLTRSQAGVWMDRLEIEHDNLRAALAWSDAASDSMVLSRLAARLWFFWYLRGHFGEAERWIALALERAADPAVRVELLQAAANLAFFQDEAVKSIGLWTETISFGRAHGDQRSVARALSRRAFMLRNIGEMERAALDAAEALALARQLGESWVLGHVLHGVAQVARGAGDVNTAEAAWTEALARFREVDEAYMVAHMLNNLGSIATQRGQLDTAMHRCTEALALIRQRDERFALRPTLVNLMRIAHRLGDDERALSMAREVITLGVAQGSPIVTANALDGIAWVAARRRAPTRAARLLGAAHGLRRAAGYADRPEQLPLQRDAEAATREALGEDGYAAAWADGEAMSLELAGAYALEEPGLA